MVAGMVYGNKLGTRYGRISSTCAGPKLFSVIWPKAPTKTRSTVSTLTTKTKTRINSTRMYFCSSRIRELTLDFGTTYGAESGDRIRQKRLDGQGESLPQRG